MFYVYVQCMFCKSPEVTLCGWRGYKHPLNKQTRLIDILWIWLDRLKRLVDFFFHFSRWVEKTDWCFVDVSRWVEKTVWCFVNVSWWVEKTVWCFVNVSRWVEKTVWCFVNVSRWVEKTDWLSINFQIVHLQGVFNDCLFISRWFTYKRCSRSSTWASTVAASCSGSQR